MYHIQKSMFALNGLLLTTPSNYTSELCLAEACSTSFQYSELSKLFLAVCLAINPGTSMKGQKNSGLLQCRCSLFFINFIRNSYATCLRRILRKYINNRCCLSIKSSYSFQMKFKIVRSRCTNTTNLRRLNNSLPQQCKAF